MKLTSLALGAIILSTPMVAGAREYGHYDLGQVATLAHSADGQNSVTVSFSYLDQIIDDLASHASGYPPHFDSADDLARARADVGSLSGMLDMLLHRPAPNSQLLLRAGILDSFGHNLDVPGAAQKAVGAFTTLLHQSPDDPRANYFYGKFLTDAGRPDDAIPILEKAKSLGVPAASYTLGVAYLTAGNMEKALENLRAYVQRTPHDPNADRMIDAIRTGRIQFRQGKPGSDSQSK